MSLSKLQTGPFSVDSPATKNMLTETIRMVILRRKKMSKTSWPWVAYLFNWWRFHSSSIMVSRILAINSNGSKWWKDGRQNVPPTSPETIRRDNKNHPCHGDHVSNTMGLLLFLSKNYPPVNKHSNGKSPSWIGNTSSNGGCSIAMLDYRSVSIPTNSSYYNWSRLCFSIFSLSPHPTTSVRKSHTRERKGM